MDLPGFINEISGVWKESHSMILTIPGADCENGVVEGDKGLAIVCIFWDFFNFFYYIGILYCQAGYSAWVSAAENSKCILQ